VKRIKERKRLAKKIARERIDILFKEAEVAATAGNFSLAERYVELMLAISRKYRVPIAKEQKYRICKKCHSFLVPGKNATVRLKKGKVVIKCEKCGNYKRYPYK